MSQSDDPKFVYQRERARTTRDEMEAKGELKSEPGHTGASTPLSHFLDAETAASTMHVINNIMGQWQVQSEDCYALIATQSVMLEANLIKWMRANPDAVARLVGKEWVK